MKDFIEALKHMPGKHSQSSHGKGGGGKNIGAAIGDRPGNVQTPTTQVSKLVEKFKPTDARTSGKRTTMTVQGSERQIRRELQNMRYKREGRGKNASFVKGDHDIDTRPTSTTTTRLIVFQPLPSES